MSKCRPFLLKPCRIPGCCRSHLPHFLLPHPLPRCLSDFLYKSWLFFGWDLLRVGSFCAFKVECLPRVQGVPGLQSPSISLGKALGSLRGWAWVISTVPSYSGILWGHLHQQPSEMPPFLFCRLAMRWLSLKARCNWHPLASFSWSDF